LHQRLCIGCRFTASKEAAFVKRFALMALLALAASAYATTSPGVISRNDA
jgi:hypothetical protein